MLTPYRRPIFPPVGDQRIVGHCKAQIATLDDWQYPTSERSSVASKGTIGRDLPREVDY